MTTGDRRVLFIFAHQDDEYAAAPWILEENSAGADVACVYLTDGGSHVSPAVRDAESCDALLALGTLPASIAFLHGDDGRIADMELAARSSEGLAMVERWIQATSFRPQRVYAPSYEGGHPDHDAAHLIAAVVAGERGLVDDTWHFSLYHAYRCPRPFFRTLRQLPTRRISRKASISNRKRWQLAFLCSHYRSQWTTWSGLFPGALWERAILGRETVVQLDVKRLAQRPHDGELLYERRFGTTYREFSDRTRGVLDRLLTAP